MSPAIVSFLFTVGATTWIYTKFQRYSGNNTKQSIIASGICGALIFVIFYYIFNTIVK